jgi:hypothetical protein
VPGVQAKPPDSNMAYRHVVGEDHPGICAAAIPGWQGKVRCNCPGHCLAHGARARMEGRCRPSTTRTLCICMHVCCTCVCTYEHTLDIILTCAALILMVFTLSWDLYIISPEKWPESLSLRAQVMSQPSLTRLVAAVVAEKLGGPQLRLRAPAGSALCERCGEIPYPTTHSQRTSESEDGMTPIIHAAFCVWHRMFMQH